MQTGLAVRLRRNCPPRLQRGLSLIELAIAASIVAVVTVIAGGRLAQQINDAAAEATGTYLLTIKGAMDAFLAAHYDDLASAKSIDGIADPLAPRLAELRLAGMLNAGFPDLTPLNQTPAIRIERTGSCPGTGCRIEALIYTTTPVQTFGSNTPSFDLVAQVVLSSGGHGGAAYENNPGVVRGTTFSLSNPLGATPGIVGVLSTLDTTQFNEFVRIRDRRDPDLQGPLTVQGPVALHDDLTVRDASGNPCVTAQNTGVLTLNCAGRLNAKTGSFTTDTGDTVLIDPTTGVIASQRVRAAAGFATSRASLFDATDAQPTIRVSGGQMLLATQDGLALTLSGTDLIAHAGASVDRLGLREVAAVNTPCTAKISTVAGSNAEFARTASGGLLVCAAGTWRALAEVAGTGAACAPNGAFATDGSTGTGLVCRLGVWVRVDDLLSSYVLVSTLLVSHGTLVEKPGCGPLGTAAGVPLIYLIPQIESSMGSAFTRRADDAGHAWQIQLLDYDGSPLAGPARAIAQLYCKY